MPVFSLSNLRDLGGLETPYGKIKNGMLYRGPALNSKNESDKDLFLNFPVDVVVDFRTSIERKECPDIIPNGAELKCCSVFDEKNATFLAPTKAKKLKSFISSKKQLNAWTKDIYDSYKRMPYSEQYQTVFDAMDEGKRIYFHCAAGKDRTGICANLIEMALGRDYEQRLKEYLLTNEFYKEFVADVKKKLNNIIFRNAFREYIMSAVSAKKEYFDTAENEILLNFNNYFEFLEKIHGIDQKRIENWRKNYIE